jgi:Txe/YoeB family toxin of Txe-Axe toxin-antitoxin module
VRRKTGEVILGEFRNDMFEGKQKFEKTLSKNEVEIYFARAIKDN